MATSQTSTDVQQGGNDSLSLFNLFLQRWDEIATDHLSTAYKIQNEFTNRKE